MHRFLLSMSLLSLVVALVSSAHAEQVNYDRAGENWDWSYGSDEGGGGTSYLGVDIADVSAERLGVLKLKEEHGAEVTMVDQDAPAGKAGLHEHDVIVSLNGMAIESTAQLRRMIKETPAGRVVNLGISRDGQPMTIKVQLADKHKSMSWSKDKFEVPEMPEVPSIPDFDMPVSVVIVHSSMRSGLMVENITGQLGEFFGIKSGDGVLVRSVEKGSRGDKAGFRAGDVVVKVNNQPVHDTSDFTHGLHSSSNTSATVTVIRDKREQTLTLTLPEKKSSGGLLEESFDDPDFTAEMEQAFNGAGDQMASLAPAFNEKWQQRLKETEKRRGELQQRRQELQERQKELQQRHREMRHPFGGGWADI